VTVSRAHTYSNLVAWVFGKSQDFSLKAKAKAKAKIRGAKANAFMRYSQGSLRPRPDLKDKKTEKKLIRVA